nr:hypothetical protein [Desulfuromonadales bacterium]
MTEDLNRCPACGGEAVPIIYGLVDPEVFDEQERDEFVLGGCCIDPWSPKWHCKACDESFGEYGDLDGPDE